MNYSRRHFVATLLVSCLTALLLWLGTGAEAQSPPPVDLSDDFNDNSLDTTKWNINAPGSPAVVSEQGQVIQIALPPNTATYNGIGSKTTHDMRDKTMEVEVVQAPSHAGWVEHSIQVALDGSNYYLVGAGSGSIVFRSVVNGAQDQTVLNYDPVAFRFWGIRHDQATNKISLQTSPDGVTWTTRKRVTAGFSLSAVYFYVYAGAWGTGNSNPGVAKYDNFQVVPSNSRAVNVANALNGATATASSTASLSFQASSAINGDRRGLNWGNNGGWLDAPPNNVFPDWLQVDFEGEKTISEIDVFGIQDNYTNPAEPTETMTFSLYGLSGFEVQYWNGTTWNNVPGGSVTGNNLVWRKFTFAPVMTSKIRVLTNASPDGWSRVAEIEAYTAVVHPLAARWRFDEGSGTTAIDSSGYGSNGTVQAATWTTGQAGSALDFNGSSSQVTLTSSAQLASVSNNFTLSFWANPRATHQIDPETTSGFGGTSGQRYAIGPKWYSNGDAGAGISVGTNGISVYEHASNYMPATLVYQANLSGWTHIVLVYKNKQPKLYVNGVLVRTGLTSPMNSVHIEPVYIGGMAYGYFNGLLDEMTIYKDSFTPSDVQAMYSSQTSYKGGTMGTESVVSAPSSGIRFFKTVKATDIASFGVGGLRNRGNGLIQVSNMPSTIKQAYLYWHGSNFSLTNNLGGALTINYVVNNVQTFVQVGGTFLGRSADNHWDFPDTLTEYPNTTAWRADITNLVNHGGPNKLYSLFAFNAYPSFNPNGASIIIFYDDGNSANDKDVYIYDGNDGNSHLDNSDSDGWFVQLSDFYYGSGTPTLDLHVADGQFNHLVVRDGVLRLEPLNDPEVKINNLPWPAANGNAFTGENANSLWEIKNFDLTQFVQHGTNNLIITGARAPDPPITLDGLNMIVAAVIVPTVREVTSVTWEGMNSALDDNPNAGGGKRIFPDWQSTADKTNGINRRVVRVKAQTTMGQGQRVFFKSFDVDEPGTDLEPIDRNNSAAGNDNRGEPQAGTLNSAFADTDSNGVATVQFTTTMNPGDNFMVAASTDQNYLNGVIATGPGLKDSAGNTLPTNNAKATPMLTVWRRLHIEVDSMEPVRGNKLTGNVLSVSRLADIVVPPPKPCTPSPCPEQYAVKVDKQIESSRYDGGGGKMTINGITYTVSLAGGDTAVVLVPTGTSSPAVTSFVLVDDDDYNSNNDGNDDEGEDVNALSDTFSWIQTSDNPSENVFAPAYIMPIRDGGGPPNNSNDESDAIFDLNVPANFPGAEALFRPQSEQHENDAFWVVYLLIAYQGQEDRDADPNFEKKGGGITFALDSDSVSSKEEVDELGGDGSLVFLETMRDVDANSSTNSPFDFRKRAVPHEIGHQLGLAGDTGPQWGIMNDTGTPVVFVPAHLNILRWRVHSPTLVDPE